MKTKKIIMFAIFIIAMVLLSSCAHVEPVKDCLEGSPYGFWGGLWHGMISPISFIIKIFNRDVAIYSVNNTGI